MHHRRLQRNHPSASPRGCCGPRGNSEAADPCTANPASCGPDISTLRPRTAMRSTRVFGTPTEVKGSPLVDKVTIISNPVFYQGAVYLFGKPTTQETYLYAL